MKSFLDPATVEQVEACIKQGLNVKEVTILPVYQGFLAYCKAKPSPYIAWMHKSMVEGLVFTAFDVIRKFSEEAFFDLLTGGFILKKAYKSVFPDYPVTPVFFYPQTHVLQLGELVIVKEGTLAGAVDSVTQLTSGALRAGLSAGKSITGMFKKPAPEESAVGLEEERITSNKTVGEQAEDDQRAPDSVKLIYLRFTDKVQRHLKSELERAGSKPDQAVKMIQRLIRLDERRDFNAAAGDMLDSFLHEAHKGGFSVETLDIKKKFLPI